MMNLGIVPWPLNADLTAYWTMWGTVATAAATVGLIVVAVFAWRAALSTLKGQQTNAEITALKDYLNALHALARVSKSTPESHMPAQFMDNISMRMQQMNNAYAPYVDSMMHDVEVTGSIWRAYHPGSSEVRSIFRQAEEKLIRAQAWRMDARNSGTEEEDSQFDLNAEFAKKLADFVGRWQVSVADRDSVTLSTYSSTRFFVAESPCAPVEEFGVTSIQIPQ